MIRIKEGTIIKDSDTFKALRPCSGTVFKNNINQFLQFLVSRDKGYLMCLNIINAPPLESLKPDYGQDFVKSISVIALEEAQWPLTISSPEAFSKSIAIKVGFITSSPIRRIIKTYII